MTGLLADPAAGIERPASPSMAPGQAVLVDGLRKAYDGRAAIDGLSFSVAEGELFALLGPNGAGKTTTVEILEGYRRADAGTVRVLGLDPTRDGASLRARLGLMLQQGGVYPQARPREILRLFARFYRDPADPDALLEQVGLSDVASTRYRVLSGGEKQRLGLALALVGRPELVVLDEPTAGMDPHAKAATRDLIAGLRSSGVTVLLTTHELADVERLADRIAVIDRGRLVALGTTAELLGGSAARLRFRLSRPLEAVDRAALEASVRAALGSRPMPRAGSVATEEAVACPARLVDDGPGRYRLDGAVPDPALVAVVTGWCADRGLLVEELRTTGGTLEERFLELTGGAQTVPATGSPEAAPAGGGGEDEPAEARR